MIKYQLICKECQISFDSWFASSREFEKLKKKNFLSCHYCDSKEIEKSLMKPNVLNKKDDHNESTLKKNNLHIKKTIKDYQNFIKKNFDYVGSNFAYEARSIHYDKKNSQGIYGSATPEETSELLEEGIEVATIPWIDKSEN